MKKIYLASKSMFLIAITVLIAVTLRVSPTVAATGTLTTSISPGSIQESDKNSVEDGDGKTIKYGSPLKVTVTASTPVDDQLGSSVSVITASTNKNCGFLLGSKGPISKFGYSQSVAIAFGKDSTNYSNYLKSVVEVYPIYDAANTGNRTCKVDFDLDLSKTSNSDIPVVYASATVKSVSATITDLVTETETEKKDTTTSSSEPTSTKTVTSTEAVVPQKPKTPTVTLIDGEGNVIEIGEDDEKPAYKQNEPIVLSGSTVPNGKVKLFIFSEPQEATVTADDDGAWTYTIETIEPGDHRVEVQVTDPETGETSDREEVVAFAVLSASDSTTENQEQISTTDSSSAMDKDSGSTNKILLVSLVILIIGLFTAGTRWYLRRRHTTEPTQKKSISGANSINSKPVSDSTTEDNTSDTSVEN